MTDEELASLDDGSNHNATNENNEVWSTASTTTVDNTSSPSIRMVIQRYRKASLLVDECHTVTVGHTFVPTANNLSTTTTANNNDDSGDKDKETPPMPSAGLLVYISFAKTATAITVQHAAKTLLNLPVLTLGTWGDGSTPKSLLQLSTEAAASAAPPPATIAEDETIHSLPKPNNAEVDTTADTSSAATANLPSLSIMLVPQANLISKVKKNGKSLQYHDQISKVEGNRLYDLLVQTIEQQLVIHEQQLLSGHKTSRNGYCHDDYFDNNDTTKNKISTPDPSIPPKELFRQMTLTDDDNSPMYGSFEEDTGLPLTMAETGKPITKSARKKLQKLYDAHVKRHEKYLLQHPPNAATTPTSSHKTEPPSPTSSSLSSSSSSTDEALDEEHEKVTASPPPQEDQEQQQHEEEEVRPKPTRVQVVSGTFGRRQGLCLESDMGPFCHVIELREY